MPGYPDWQNYPQWAGPIVGYAVDSLLLAGATVEFEDIETVHYRNIYAIIGCRNNNARFRFRFRDEAWAIVPELGVYTYVNTLDQFHWVIPNMGGLFEAIQVTAAAAGNVNFDLWVIPTNADAQSIYAAYSAPMLHQRAVAVVAGATSSFDLKPFTGWATIHISAESQNGIFELRGRDHNGNFISNVFREWVLATTSKTFTVWIPPLINRADIFNNSGVNAQFSYSITPAWPHP